MNRAPMRIMTMTVTVTKTMTMPTQQITTRMVMRTSWTFLSRVSCLNGWKDAATFQPRIEMSLWEAGFKDFMVMELADGSYCVDGGNGGFHVNGMVFVLRGP